MSLPDVFKEAGARVEGWHHRFGLSAKWAFGSQHLVLTARRGHWRSTQKVPWEKLEQARFPEHELRDAEQRVLNHFTPSP